MNENIIKEISNTLKIKENSIKETLTLLESGNTIPFIARYRKEVTGALDEEQIRKINEFYEYQVNLLKRKEDVIRLIDEKGLLTPDLKNQILAATKLVEVEDLYRPYKEKKKTKATDAIKNGLEPLAKIIMSFPINGNLETLATKYINENVKDVTTALEGSSYIIAEWISDSAYYRKWIRNYVYYNGVINTKLKRDAIDEKKVYEMYYDYKEKVKEIKPHRILAINRAENEKVISVSIDINSDEVINYLESRVIKNTASFVCNLVKLAIKDAYKRLIYPSIEREIRSDLTEDAELVAVDNFSKNLEKLLLTPPLKGAMVLGLDPAYRTGCKLAVIDASGKKLEIAKIYPHVPVNKYEEAKKITIDLINKYNVDIIAIGNGTASRESEAFIVDVIKSLDKKIEYIIVSEAGASVYSASKLAISEFPDLLVEERSAISIGRRLQDPLSELVKIDPKSIGVGLYQHDISNKLLTESLDFVVYKAVNSVGVNINTASASLLKYVSGLTSTVIDKILNYRDLKGKIQSREELKKAKVLSPKTYEQAIGFLRIADGVNKLDITGIHPESYNQALALLKLINMNIEHIGTDKIIAVLDSLNINELKDKLNIDIYTLEDIIKSLKKPNLDPRDEMPKPLLRSDILHIEDLKEGMPLEGTVRNVIDFGAFVDIGLHDDGLVHISKMSDKYIHHPSDILSVGDIVTVYVDKIDLERNKVSLSLLKP